MLGWHEFLLSSDDSVSLFWLLLVRDGSLPIGEKEIQPLRGR